MRLIDADALMKTLGIDKDCSVCEQNDAPYCRWKPDVVDVCEAICDAPAIEPERKVEELLPDGTLHLFTDTDLSKVKRVWVSQNGTHYGDLYYADGEPKIGKWQEHEKYPNLAYLCSECGYFTTSRSRFCPNCGSYNGGEQE